MSWFQVLKDEETPEPRVNEKQIPSFQEKVMGTARWMRSRRKEILDAVTTDDALEKFREDPDIMKLIEEKNSTFIRDIEFIKRLLTEDTVTTNQNTFKSLKEKLGARATQMAERLDLLGKAKKTSSGNIRESTQKTFESMIAGGKWEELLQALQDEKRKSRFKQLISSNPPLRKKIYDATRDKEYADTFSIILNRGQDDFVSIDYTGNIADSTVKKYLKHLLTSVKAPPVDKNKFIIDEFSGKQQMTKLFHFTKGLNPALEFLLDNQDFDTSKMVKGKMMRDSFANELLVTRLQDKGKNRVVEIPNVLQSAYDLPATFLVGNEVDRTKRKTLLEAKKRGNKEFLRQLERFYPDEVKQFKEALLEYQKTASDEVEQGQTYKELLEDIETESLGFVGEALGEKITSEQFESRKKELTDKVKRLIEGKAEEGDEDTFPGISEERKKEHPFLSEGFTKQKIIGKRLGVGATPADIVIVLLLASNITKGGFTVSEVVKYFNDIEKIKTIDEVEGFNTFLDADAKEDEDLETVRARADEEVRDKFLDEARKDYSTVRKDLIDRIKENMRQVLKEGMKIGNEFDRRAKATVIDGEKTSIKRTTKDMEGNVVPQDRINVPKTYSYLEPYFYLINLLDIET